ncbi:DNA-directed DNA polymerase [Saliniradius amylolyticus]|uniref:DNA-directed DNA polymerase n=1 Tax=Saliniradius amylolyticus TaxID=2183582 RepID=A0A2S2E687_9ALTE|nr:DNA polymerase III subunit chi [Saliniradius amylolyticus]AWL13153.1 DNA-directed DNA polymerase [Saliniradius amylolyticus]
MPRVCFYLLDEQGQKDEPASYALACHLAARSYSQRQPCLILCATQAQAEILDELLWQRPAERFIPHNLQGEGPKKGTPVEITWQLAESPRQPVLINLSSSIPDNLNRFRQIYDFVPVEDELKQRARERYKAYRSAGCQLDTQPASSLSE